MGPVTEWYDELDRKHRKELELTARQLLKDKEYAEDIVQETFEELLKQYETLDHESNLRYWLLKVLRNKIMSHNQLAFLDREVELVPEHEPSAEDLYGNSFLEQLPEGLKDHEKLILYLRIEAGYSHEQIGKRLGCTAFASGMRFLRAKLRCKELLEENFERTSYNLDASTKEKNRRCNDV